MIFFFNDHHKLLSIKHHHGDLIAGYSVTLSSTLANACPLDPVDLQTHKHILTSHTTWHPTTWRAQILTLLELAAGMVTLDDMTATQIMICVATIVYNTKRCGNIYIYISGVVKCIRPNNS